jgi:hypothetical protein
MPATEENLIDDLQETLLRQVHPNFVVDARLTSQAFQPNRSDDGLLSVDRRQLIDPKSAYEAYLARGLDSRGVWGLLVGEFSDVGLRSFNDPIDDAPSHAVVDYSGLSGKPLKRAATKLAAIARSRGKLYPAENLGASP